MIRHGTEADFDEILSIINDAAIAYRGVIPADRWREPYMTKDELQSQIEAGVRFSVHVVDDGITGVMGVQAKEDVALIRHAYVRSSHQGKGIGSLLLRRLTEGATRPILVGTWSAATWAIRFYESHGFHLVTDERKNELLRKYWTVPDRQVESSVVLSMPGDDPTTRSIGAGPAVPQFDHD